MREKGSLSARNVLTLLDMAPDWMSRLNDGAAIIAKIAEMASTTINSTNVKPRLFIESYPALLRFR